MSSGICCIASTHCHAAFPSNASQWSWQIMNGGAGLGVQQKGQDITYSTAFARAMAGHKHARDESQAKVAAALTAAQQAERSRCVPVSNVSYSFLCLSFPISSFLR